MVWHQSGLLSDCQKSSADSLQPTVWGHLIRRLEAFQQYISGVLYLQYICCTVYSDQLKGWHQWVHVKNPTACYWIAQWPNRAATKVRSNGSLFWRDSNAMVCSSCHSTLAAAIFVCTHNNLMVQHGHPPVKPRLKTLYLYQIDRCDLIMNGSYADGPAEQIHLLVVCPDIQDTLSPTFPPMTRHKENRMQQWLPAKKTATSGIQGCCTTPWNTGCFCLDRPQEHNPANLILSFISLHY